MDKLIPKDFTVEDEWTIELYGFDHKLTRAEFLEHFGFDFFLKEEMELRQREEEHLDFIEHIRQQKGKKRGAK